MRSILMDFAQFEREMISERTRDKFAAMARKGKRLGGVPALGYNFDTKTKSLVVNTDESKTVEEIFLLYQKLKSLRLTAERLNERGIRMKSWMKRDGSSTMGGGVFTKTNLFYLLSNPLYTGKIRYKHELFPGEHKAIISEGLFDGVNEQLRINGDGKHFQPRRADTGYTYLLQGILRCGSCGYTMTPHYAISKGRRYHYYKCVPVMKMDHKACAVKSVPAAQIDQLVLARLKILANDAAIMEDIVDKSEKTTNLELPVKYKERALITAEFGKIEQELANIFKMMGQEGPDSPRKSAILEQLDKSAAKKEDLKNQLAEANKEIQKLESQTVDADIVRNNLVRFTDVFGELGPSHQRELMALIVQRVVYDIQGKSLKITLRPLPEMKWELEHPGVVLQPVQESSPIPMVIEL